MAKHVIIHGRVQGVGYRAWTVSTAKKLGVHGWVRNLTDGTVEALFHGESSQLSAMLDACHKGPLVAKVTRVDARDSDHAPTEGFASRPTTDPGAS